MSEVAYPQHRPEMPDTPDPWELPFMQLAKRLENLRLWPCSTQEVSKPLQSESQLLKTHNDTVMPVIEALFPRELVEEHRTALASSHRQREHIRSAYMKLVTYAATNNFAGVDGLISHTMMYEYLCTVMTTSLSHDSSAVTRWPLLFGNPSAKPMTETFFRCAIEAGNVEAVRHLSLSPEARINVNEQVCVADGMNYTPVERSAALHHLALTRLLVDLQADVARTCNNDDKYRDDGNLLQCSGALDWALLRCCQGEGISLELVNTVLQAGGSVSVKIMRKILRPELSTVVQAIVGARLSTAQQKWTRKKVLHEIIHRMDKDTVLATVRSMYAIGASLTYKLYENKETAEVFRIPRYPPRIIDIAAERGDLDVILLLKTFNVPWTDDTLTAAVRAGNIDLVSYVLEDNPVAQGYSPHYRSTPYAEAIRHRSPDIIHLLIERGCMDYLQDEFTFCSTLAAASEIGDFPLVKSLLELSHNAKSNILGYALTHAISANRTDIALLLLDAGASTARDRNVQVLGFTCIDISLQNEQDELTYLLGTACKNRNAILVQALLDHDASVFDCYSVSPLAEAVEWGDRSIIKSFITAGSSDRWTGGESVLAAMKKQDCEFMRLLLQSGIPYGERSLENAVRYGDEQMVRELLMYGACPADSYALVAAMETAPALFSLLVRETRRRYPQGTTECNKAILAAVDKGQPETVQTLLQCVGANQLGRV